MKLGITLTVIGGILVLDGTVRLTMGLMSLELGLVIGGVLTGWVLGGSLLFFGIRRIVKAKKGD